MPSEANAKHADTSHAQNRRSPHLYPSRRSQGSTYVGVPPPFALCLYPLQASWHLLHIKRRAHKNAGTQFLFQERLWNSVARLPVEGPHSHLSCESTFLPWPQDWRSTRERVQVSVRCFVLFGRQERTHTDISMYNHSPMRICTCAWTRTELSWEARGLQSVRNECSFLFRVKTCRLVYCTLSGWKKKSVVVVPV